MVFNQYPYINETDLNLDYVLKKMKTLVDLVESLEAWKTGEDDKVNQLYEWYQSLVDGNLTPEMIAAINKWCSENLIDLVGEMVKMIFFGINDDGYFVAYIPEGWTDITFGTTGLDDFPAGIDYGHLTLTY